MNSFTPATPRPPEGFSEGLATPASRWNDRDVFLRSVPGVVVLGLVLLVAFLTVQERTGSPWFLTSVVLLLGSLVVAFAFPWDRMPAWCTSLPSFMLLGAIATSGAAGLRVSVVALVPLIDLVRNHGRWGGVLGVVAATAASASEYLVTDVQFGPNDVLRMSLLPMVFITITMVVGVLERRAVARQLLLVRQGRALIEANESLDVDRALFHGLVSGISVGVVALDAAGRIVHANETAARCTTLALTEGVDVAVLDGDGSPMVDYLLRARSGDPVEHETRWWTLPDGEQVALRASVVRVSTLRGAYAVLVLEDLTAEVSAVREREDFLGAVSHELRTPLTAVLGYLEMVIDDDDTPTGSRARLMIAERNVQRLENLVEDLLADATARHHFTTPVLTDVVLADLVRDAALTAAPRAGAADVNLETVLDPDVVVRGDATALSQVIDNLLSNAVKYSDAGGAVVVSVAREHGWGLLEVADTGIGIAQADQARLFERFFRAEAVRGGQRHGTGLGLSLVQEIITAHGGLISLTSELGEGTRVLVRLPLERRHGSRS